MRFFNLRLLRLISAADMFTLANGLLGLLAILFIKDGDSDSLRIAVGLTFTAIFMDGLDGLVARKFGSKHTFGIYLDSLADSISFCFMPALFVYAVFYDLTRGHAYEDLQNFLAVIASLLIGVLGIIRLAVFAYSREDTLPYFSGLPTPANTFFVLVIAVLLKDHYLVVLPLVTFSSLLMVSDFCFPKMRGSVQMVALVALMAGAAGTALEGEPVGRALLSLALFLAISYYFHPIMVSCGRWKKGCGKPGSDREAAGESDGDESGRVKGMNEDESGRVEGMNEDESGRVEGVTGDDDTGAGEPVGTVSGSDAMYGGEKK